MNAGGDDEDEDEPPRPSSPSYKADASTEDGLDGAAPAWAR